MASTYFLLTDQTDLSKCCIFIDTDFSREQSPRTRLSTTSRRRLTGTGRTTAATPARYFPRTIRIANGCYVYRCSIKKPKTSRYPSLKGTDPKFRRNHRHALHGTAKALVRSIPIDSKLLPPDDDIHDVRSRGSEKKLLTYSTEGVPGGQEGDCLNFLSFPLPAREGCF